MVESLHTLLILYSFFRKKKNTGLMYIDKSINSAHNVCIDYQHKLKAGQQKYLTL